MQNEINLLVTLVLAAFIFALAVRLGVTLYQ